ncbi:MAG: phosphatidylserine decarboxylase family protein [Bacteroidota bacterium]|nr:phosphatidylserine decarboxylase family protein [Bacteroidota bacterium]
MRIHKEGFTTLTIVFLISFCTLISIAYFVGEGYYLYFISVLCAAFFLFFLQFFRNPLKNIQFNENNILAPADGRVVVIEKTFETEFLKQECIQISIFMSPFNVHVNRNPASGIVKYFKYHPGKYLVAWHPKSSTENERTTTAIECTNGDKILYRQIAGALARRIKWYIKEGDYVEQGQEFGFIKFGSRVDIFIPTYYKVNVQIDQVTYGGETVIAFVK